MIDSQLEEQLRDNAEAVFGKGKELPAGHRERFEQRLKSFREGRKDVQGNRILNPIRQVVGKSKLGKIISSKKWLVASVAVAALLAGFVFVLNPFEIKTQSDSLVDLCYYYNIQIKEQAAYTRQLISQVDETNREILFANVDFIENEPIPDVQLSDDDYCLLITNFYENKIETLQNIQDLICTTD